MTRSLHVYATDFERVTQVVGSQDLALVRSIVRPEDPPALQAALEELAQRGDPRLPWRSSPEWLAHAQERLCAHFGQALPNESVSATSLMRLEELDAGLATHGLGLTLHSLMYGGGPIRSLPWPDDFPSTGRWPAEAIGPAVELYDRLAPTSDDPDVDALLVDLEGWLRIAHAKRNGIVGVYY